jgi:hypothetical protein
MLCMPAGIFTHRGCLWLLAAHQQMLPPLHRHHA